MSTSKKSEKTSSKFSGLLAQARTREESLPEEELSEEIPMSDAASSVSDKTPTVTVVTDSVPALDDRELHAVLPAPPRGRGKRSNPDFTQITAYIRVETHQKVKNELLYEAIERASAGERGAKPRELSEVVEDVLQLWLDEQKNKK